MPSQSLIIKPHGCDDLFKHWSSAATQPEWPALRDIDRWGSAQDGKTPRLDAVLDALLNGTFDIELVKVGDRTSADAPAPIETIRYKLYVPENVRRGWMQS
jgi:hypothetical protein